MVRYYCSVQRVGRVWCGSSSLVRSWRWRRSTRPSVMIQPPLIESSNLYHRRNRRG